MFLIPVALLHQPRASGSSDARVKAPSISGIASSSAIFTGFDGTAVLDLRILAHGRIIHILIERM